jgi:hypothetical protein
MVYHSGTPSAEYPAGFVPFVAGRGRSAAGGRNNLAAAVDRWEDEGGFVRGTVPARPPQATISSSTTDEVDALASQVSRVARALASDYSEGRIGIRYNTFQHRSRVLRQMSACLEAMGTRGAASTAREQSQ